MHSAIFCSYSFSKIVHFYDMCNHLAWSCWSLHPTSSTGKTQEWQTEWHGGDKLSDKEVQLQTPRRARRPPFIRKGMGNTMYPQTVGSILMSDTTVGLPVPSQQGPVVGEDGELKKEVA